MWYSDILKLLADAPWVFLDHLNLLLRGSTFHLDSQLLALTYSVLPTVWTGPTFGLEYIVSKRTVNEHTETSRYTRVSSTYKEMHFSKGPHFTPCRASNCLIKHSRASTAIVKSNDKRQKLCQVLICKYNVADTSELLKTLACGPLKGNRV